MDVKMFFFLVLINDEINVNFMLFVLILLVLSEFII